MKTMAEMMVKAIRQFARENKDKDIRGIVPLEGTGSTSTQWELLTFGIEYISKNDPESKYLETEITVSAN